MEQNQPEKSMGGLKHISWNEVTTEDLNPLFARQIVVGENVMVARIILRKGCRVPLHSHINEQISYIVEGVLRFRIHGREIDVKAGEVLCIPPNLPHEAEALEDTLDLDIFYPPRADWLSGQDAYLRR
jgi:quercetin dioxygenase-like cupin family protein